MRNIWNERYIFFLKNYMICGQMKEGVRIKYYRFFQSQLLS